MNSRVVIASFFIAAAPTFALAQPSATSVSPRRLNYATQFVVPNLAPDDQAKGGVSQREIHGLIGGAIGFVSGAVVYHIVFRNTGSGCDVFTTECDWRKKRRQLWWAKTLIGGAIGFPVGTVVGAMLPHDADKTSQKQPDEK